MIGFLQMPNQAAMNLASIEQIGEPFRRPASRGKYEMELQRIRLTDGS